MPYSAEVRAREALDENLVGRAGHSFELDDLETAVEGGAVRDEHVVAIDPEVQVQRSSTSSFNLSGDLRQFLAARRVLSDVLEMVRALVAGACGSQLRPPA